jgi:pimeloyl-ACP methyl ester carboxylesterase
VLALHCSGSTGRQWDRYAVAMSHLDVIAPELLGYGSGTPAWTNGTPVSLDDEAAHLAPLLDARPQGVHLLGHSYGGAVALQIALRWPSRVKSLTLYEPVRFALLKRHPDTAQAAEEIVGTGRRIGFAALSGRTFEAARIFVDYWSGDGSWLAMDSWRREALALRMHKIRAEFEALFADRVPLAAYGRLEMPVRLITGDRSPLPARQIVDRLATVLPQAQVVRIPYAGHMAPVTDAGRILAALPAVGRHGKVGERLAPAAPLREGPGRSPDPSGETTAPPAPLREGVPA